jgi:hypothetical protein
VIAYHGCDSGIAERVLAGADLKPSDNDYDWLGRGIYFWEYGADRALQFAQEQVLRGKVKQPTYVGALLQLGKCFDLMDTRFTEDLAAAYGPWSATLRQEGHPLPLNAGHAPDHKLRRLDCAVINWYLANLQADGLEYDTVRCGFTEGAPIYPGSGVFQESHIQIAVRNPSCILGVFRPKIEKS